MERSYCVIDVIALGDSCVGKTYLLQRCAGVESRGTYTATVGADVFSRIVTVNNTRVRFHLWDTAGQERYMALTQSFLRRARVIWMLYNRSNVSSVQHLLHVWWPLIRSHLCRHGVVVCIVAARDRPETLLPQASLQHLAALEADISSTPNVASVHLLNDAPEQLLHISARTAMRMPQIHVSTGASGADAPSTAQPRRCCVIS